MTGAREAAGTPDEVRSAPPARAPVVGPPLWHAAALLALWMVAVLGFAAIVVVALAGLPPVLAGIAIVPCLLAPLASVPLLLYDASRCRGTVAGSGFRFDPLLTGVFLLAIYPLGGAVYAVNRVQGPYLAAIGVDPDELDLASELVFGVDDLLQPATEGVPAWWPGALVLFLWLAVLVGDGALLVGLLSGDTAALVAGAFLMLLIRLFVTPLVWLDAVLLWRTDVVGAGEAALLGAAMTVLYPVAAVGHLPYRIVAAYG